MTHNPNVLEKANLETLQEIIREAESYLEAQLTCAIAADQRAIAFAGSLSAAVAVVGAASIAAILSGKFATQGWVGLITTMGLILAMALALVTSRPIKFEYVGNSPDMWLSDVAEGKTLAQALAEQANHYTASIKSNNEAMSTNNLIMRWAYGITWASLAFGIVGFLFSLPCS